MRNKIKWLFIATLILVPLITACSVDEEAVPKEETSNTESSDKAGGETKEDKEPKKDSVETTGKLSEEELLENQMENLNKKLDEIIDGDIILDIRLNPNQKQTGEFMQVVVSDTWYNSPSQDKERFANVMHQEVSGAVWNSGLQEHGSTIIVDIIDSYDKEVATFNILTGNYKIKW